MSSAPGWVTHLALALSAGSLVVAVLAYRAGGPRLRLQGRRLPAAEFDPFPGGVAVALTVVNSGRAAVNVEGFHVTWPAGRRPLADVENVDEPTLPHRLEAHASETWIVDALPAARAVDRESGGRDDPLVGAAQFRFGVAAGNGKAVHDGFTFTAVRIIAEARGTGAD